MRIAFDLTPALRQGGGIGRLTRELARTLVGRHAADYRLVVTDRMAKGEAEAVARDYGAPVRTAPAGQWLLTVLWQRLRWPLPAEMLFGRADVYHATDFLAPPLWRTPAVVTVHDLSYLIHPELAEPSLARFLTTAVPRSLAKAAQVIADSEHTKRDLARLMELDEGRVTVVYPGLGEAFRQAPSEAKLAEVRRRFGLDKPFVLGVGTLEPRKEWPLLIEAFGRMVHGGAENQAGSHVAGSSTAGGSERTARDELALVIAGGRGWRREALDRALAEAHASGLDVRLLGFVADEDLPALYRLARVFAYPSAYEGFGLPPLEALAAGLPTVVAQTSSLPEVVGEAALMVPPGDGEALALALSRLVGDDGLRERLGEAGPKRAAGFTWARAAEAVETIYADVVNRAGRRSI